MRNRRRVVSKKEKLYGISVIVLLMGICVGAIFANYINSIQKQELLNYMDEFFLRFPQENLPYSEVLKECILTHGKNIGLLWVLGIGIIGIPFILIIVFIKGFSYGFTSAFLFVNYGLDGFLFSVLSYIPQNLILIPGIIFVSAASINFAVSNHKNTPKYAKERSKKWMEYGLVLLIGLLFIILTGVIETFISPLLMKIFMSNMLK